MQRVKLLRMLCSSMLHTHRRVILSIFICQTKIVWFVSIEYAVSLTASGKNVTFHSVINYTRSPSNYRAPPNETYLALFSRIKNESCVMPKTGKFLMTKIALMTIMMILRWHCSHNCTATRVQRTREILFILWNEAAADCSRWLSRPFQVNFISSKTKKN